MPDHLPRRDAGTVTARLRVSTPVEHTTESEVPRQRTVQKCLGTAKYRSAALMHHSTVWQHLSTVQYGSTSVTNSMGVVVRYRIILLESASLFCSSSLQYKLVYQNLVREPFDFRFILYTCLSASAETDRPTNQSNNRPTDKQIASQGSYTSNNSYCQVQRDVLRLHLPDTLVLYGRLLCQVRIIINNSKNLIFNFQCNSTKHVLKGLRRPVPSSPLFMRVGHFHSDKTRLSKSVDFSQTEIILFFRQPVCQDEQSGQANYLTEQDKYLSMSTFLLL